MQQATGCALTPLDTSASHQIYARYMCVVLPIFYPAGALQGIASPGAGISAKANYWRQKDAVTLLGPPFVPVTFFTMDSEALH